MLGGALTVGVTSEEVQEVVYQAVPYVGTARAFGFLHATNDVLQSRGIELPLPGQSTTNPDTRLAKGPELQRRLLGERIDQLYERSPRDQIHFQRHLSANCFGDYYTRTGLDLKTRELPTFSMLASLGGCELRAGPGEPVRLHATPDERAAPAVEDLDHVVGRGDLDAGHRARADRVAAGTPRGRPPDVDAAAPASVPENATVPSAFPTRDTDVAPRPCGAGASISRRARDLRANPTRVVPSGTILASFTSAAAGGLRPPSRKGTGDAMYGPNGPDTFWLDFTNIALGLVTLACVLVMAWGVGRELLYRLGHSPAPADDDHAFTTPDLGITMADGGERTDARRVPKTNRLSR